MSDHRPWHGEADGGATLPKAAAGTRRALAGVPWQRLRPWSQVGILALAAILLSWQLTAWPPPWFDEGMHLTAAATLARHGVYGLPDGDRIIPFDPGIQIGPVLVLIVAAVFKIGGIGLFQARLAMILLAFLALLAYRHLALFLGGGAAAALGLVFLLLGNGDPFASFIPMGRQMLGEVFATGFLCLGFWLLSRGAATPRWPRWYVAAGFACGAAMLTKSQVLLVLPVACGVAWLLDRHYYRATPPWALIVAIGTGLGLIAAWQGLARLGVGPVLYAQNSAVLREGVTTQLLSFSPGNVRRALGTLYRLGFFFWGVPGLIYGLALARPRTKEGLAQLLPLLFIGVWLVWFTLFSIGWSRYACIPALLTTLYSGRLLADLGHSLWQRRGAFEQRALPRLALFALLIGALLRNGALSAEALRVPPERDLTSFALLLDRDIPAGATIESWEWELDFVTDHTYLHPSTGAIYAYTLAVSQQQPPARDYRATDDDATYLIDGPFSSWTGIYAAQIAERGVLVARSGRYALYRLR